MGGSVEAPGQQQDLIRVKGERFADDKNADPRRCRVKQKAANPSACNVTRKAKRKSTPKPSACRFGQVQPEEARNGSKTSDSPRSRYNPAGRAEYRLPMATRGPL